MKLYLDDGNDKKSFFVSVPTAIPDEYLSFDWTLKGHRMLIQHLTETNVKVTDRQPDAKWDTLVIEDGRLVEKQHNVWFDFGKNDVVDGEKWKQVQEWPLHEREAQEMLQLSNLIRQQQNQATQFSRTVNSLESLVRTLAKRRGVSL